MFSSKCSSAVPFPALSFTFWQKKPHQTWTGGEGPHRRSHGQRGSSQPRYPLTSWKLIMLAFHIQVRWHGLLHAPFLRGESSESTPTSAALSFWLHYKTKFFSAVISVALMSRVPAEIRGPVINSSGEARVRESKRRGDRDALYAPEQRRYS